MLVGVCFLGYLRLDVLFCLLCLINWIGVFEVNCYDV